MSDARVVLPYPSAASERPPAVVLPFPQAHNPDQGRLWDRLGAPLPRLMDPTAPFSGRSPDIRIDTGDVVISIGTPAVHGTRTQDDDPNFGANLAKRTGPDITLGVEIADGVGADVTSRSQWIQEYVKGLDLLGTKIEQSTGRSAGQRRNISRVGHPLMIEAMVKQQASAEGEMLPAAGPCKVPTIGRSGPDEETRAKDFQDDFNYVLTDVMPEYYPDTSSMLMHKAFCGLGYKKVYRDPIRNRPTSQSILAPNLIVSEEATDLQTAHRVTHEIEMTRANLKRMQILGDYIDVELGMPNAGMGLGREAQRALMRSQGLSVSPPRPQDMNYLIWETDTDLDPAEWGLIGSYERKAPAGMPLPYKVAVDQTTRKVLGIWRNWRPRDRLFLKRNMYVKFSLIPSLGFHSWGFLHLLGNQTMALRAIWRLLIDAGMFSNFPGGIKAKNARTETNEVAPGPGEWIDVDFTAAPGVGLKDMFMPMPYQGPNSVFVQLSEIIKQDAMRLGATVQLEVGEGRSNVPVGTVMAMIEQQMQVMSAAHKRDHRAQKEELILLRELWADDIEGLNKFCAMRPRPGDQQPRLWSVADEFMDLNLQPASDPNVPAQIMRINQAQILVLLAQQAPQLFDVPEIARYAVQMIGADPDRFLARPDQNQQQQGPDPKTIAATLKAQADQQKNQIQAAKIGADQQTDMAKLQVQREELALDASKAAAEAETKRVVESGKLAAATHQPGIAVGLGGAGQTG